MGQLLELVEQMMHEGKSADKCLENLLYYFRDLLMIKMVPGADQLTDRVLNPADFRDMAKAFTRDRLFLIVETLSRYLGEMKYATHPQTIFEVALMKLCSGPQDAAAPSVGDPAVNAAAPAAANGSPQVQSVELDQLRAQIAALEKKLEQAIQAGGVAGGGREQAAQRTAPPSAPRVSSASKLPPQLDKFIAGKDSPDFSAVYKQWSLVLQGVKEEKVTVHAWFVDGEPVAVMEDAVLVAFKNTIHRDTTENVMNAKLGKPFRLVTMMMRDWNEAATKSAASAGTEELRLEHEHESGEGKSEPWIDEAIQLFGEDLVVIKE
jgi:DNA polymerase-3 subunit gamma/tau